MKLKGKKARMQLKWRRAEQFFIEELDRKLKYNWRDKIDKISDFYDKGYIPTKDKPKSLMWESEEDQE